MDRNPHDPEVCTCCCGLSAEEAEELATLDQTEMTLSLPRKIGDIRDAARLCAICVVLLKVLSFFSGRHDGHEHAKVLLLLPVGPGNVQIAFRARGVHSVAQLYSSDSKSGWRGLGKQAFVPRNMLIRFQSCLGLGSAYFHCPTLVQTSFRHKAKAS